MSKVNTTSVVSKDGTLTTIDTARYAQLLEAEMTIHVLHKKLLAQEAPNNTPPDTAAFYQDAQRLINQRVLK